jgi:AmmeMemoRadiSam system protein B
MSVSQPTFDPSAPHQLRPHLRRVRLFPAQMANQQAMGIADAQQLSEKMVLTSPAAQFVLPLMDGTRDLATIVTAVQRGLTIEILQQLVAQLDDAGLLFGPAFDALQARVHQEFDSSDTLPPASTAALADAAGAAAAGGQEAWDALDDAAKEKLGAERLVVLLDEWISMALKDAEKPSLDALPQAIVAPHLDYPRGWINYASVWGRLRVVDRPARVVILGTNHFGQGTGVVGCDKGFASPLGTCDLDRAFFDALRRELGPEQTQLLLKDRFDHEREHSIELQIPWVQHVFGKDEAGKHVPVFAALMHDPTANAGQSYDGNGLAFDPFVEALRAAIAKVPGKTLVVCSADLSHVGMAFGDQVQLVGEGPEIEENRNRVFRHDRDMLKILMDNKPDELLTAFSWQGNHTRWCSIGALVATWKVCSEQGTPGSGGVELFNYAGAMDEQGTTLVTSVSMVVK